MPGKTVRAGYGGQHQKLRRVWAQIVEAGAASCARCGRWIIPGEPWDLDHANDRTGYLGAAHRGCNRRAGARKGNRRRARRRFPPPREW